MKTLTLADMQLAFDIMGKFLRDRKTLGEIAVYGGSAILLQFDWRVGTQDVDAVIVSDGNHGIVRQAADFAAQTLGLERSWLSEAVAQYASASAKTGDLTFVGLYPEAGVPGLRVSAARPEYLLAMKVSALQRATAQDRDFSDLVRLAGAIGAETQEQIEAVYRDFFPDQALSPRSRLRLPEVVRAILHSKDS